jgi:hypothetical protein
VALLERTRGLSALARGGIAVTAGAVVAQSLLHLAYVVVFDRHHKVISVDAEASVAAWLGSMGEFACGVFVLLLAIRFPARRRMLGVLAAVLMFFSLDDIVSIHERLARLGTDALNVSHDYDAVLWPILYLPLLLIVAIGLARIGRDLGGEVLLLVVAGLGLLVLGVLLEVVGPGIRAIGLGRFAPEVVLEEGAELAGWGLAATGLLLAVVAQFESPAPVRSP